MTRLVLSLSLSVLSIVSVSAQRPDVPGAQTAPPITTPSDHKFDLVGFSALDRVVTWLRGLPTAFDRFVSSEKRDQLARQMQTVSDAFGRINQGCVDLALLVEDATTGQSSLEKPFALLLESIKTLRGELLALAGQLGVEAGKEGESVAFELASLTRHRADMTAEAKRQVFGGERTTAAKRLRDASALAEEAQKLVIGFIPALKK